LPREQLLDELSESRVAFKVFGVVLPFLNRYAAEPAD
jgi:hypothetical protein